VLPTLAVEDFETHMPAHRPKSIAALYSFTAR
jgi:hypothetical protein